MLRLLAAEGLVSLGLLSLVAPSWLATRCGQRTGGLPQIEKILAGAAADAAEDACHGDTQGEPPRRTLAAALNGGSGWPGPGPARAVERRNMAMFTPVGHPRELAAATMRLAGEAIADGDTALAAGVLGQAQPESPDGEAATVSACIGFTLGLLDQWLSGHDTSVPPALAHPGRSLPGGRGLSYQLCPSKRGGPTRTRPCCLLGRA